MKNIKKTRRELVNYLYQYDLLKMELEIEEEISIAFKDIISKQERIDEIITDNLTNYTLERLSYLDRAIIRLATYELTYTELAKEIIINEAVNITKEISDLDDEKQHKFTNKLLDEISRSVRE